MATAADVCGEAIEEAGGGTTSAMFGGTICVICHCEPAGVSTTWTATVRTRSCRLIRNLYELFSG